MSQAREGTGDRPGWKAFATFGALVFVLLFARSMSRPLDWDEHQFVAPAALLAEDHRLPYRDYPYFHMPDLVFLYAGLIGRATHKLLLARLISVACGTATLLLLFAEGWRGLKGLPRGFRWLVAGGVVVIYLCSRLFTYTNGWAWNHDSAVLCCVAAYCCYLRGTEGRGQGYLAAAGFLVGAAMGIRLSFALAFVPFTGALLFGRHGLTVRQRGVGLGLAALAAALALAPAWALWAASPERFLFGNLGYARVNTLYYASYTSAMTVPGKLWHFGQTFLSDPGNALLLAGFLFAVGSWARRGRPAYRGRMPLLVGLTLALLAGAWGPTPTQYQYYYMLLPFLALAVFDAIAAQAGDPRAQGRWARVVTAGLAVVALTGLPRWYWTVVYLPRPGRWVPFEVHKAGRWVKANTPAGTRVLTPAPLIPLEGGMRVYPDYAVGRFVFHVGGLLSPERRHRLGMCWGEELDRLLAEQPPGAILFDRPTLALAPALLGYARANGFRALDSPDGDYQLWVRPPPP
jgi:4-amino-4-deoxy-L-arabinose transferase-like glycosyltransferase